MMQLNITSRFLMKIVFFDNDCGLCNSAVRFVLKRDRKKVFFFAPLVGKTAEKELGEWRKTHPNVDSLVLLETGETPRFSFYSRSIVRIAWLLGWPWSFFGLLSFLPNWMLVPGDALYRFIASRRRQFCSLQKFNTVFCNDPDRLLP
jgi:predicted DCC family thiol-disulfide oxidoreductase YuxK